MINKKISIFLIAKFAFFSNILFAGAWVQKKGDALSISVAQYYRSEQYWTPSGRILDAPLYTKGFGSEYIEYGLTDNLTLGGFLSGLQSRDNNFGTATGMLDHLLLGRYQLYRDDDIVISSQIFADYLGKAAQFNIPPQNTNLNTGEFLSVGTSGTIRNQKAEDVNWFCDASLGLVQRYGPGNQVQLILEAGWKFHSEKFWFFMQSFNTLSTRETSKPTVLAYNLFTIAPSVIIWPTSYLGVQLGATQDIYGQNVGKGTGPFVSIWYKI